MTETVRKGVGKARIGALPRYLSLRKRYQSRCPNSFVQERTTTKLLVKWRSRRGKVNDWGKKVCESRSQGQRERRRGLIECHFTRIGRGYMTEWNSGYWFPALRVKERVLPNPKREEVPSFPKQERSHSPDVRVVSTPEYWSRPEVRHPKKE